MIQAAKIIGTGLATTGLIGAGVGIGVVLGALILAISYLGSIYLLFSIGVCAILILFLCDNLNKYSHIVDIFLTSFISVMIIFMFFLALDLLYFICSELFTYIKLFKIVLVHGQFICMAVSGMPSAGSTTVWEARGKDRVTAIIFNKICNKYNIPEDVKLYMHDYIRFYWLYKYDRAINRRYEN